MGQLAPNPSRLQHWLPCMVSRTSSTHIRPPVAVLNSAGAVYIGEQNVRERS